MLLPDIAGPAHNVALIFISNRKYSLVSYAQTGRRHGRRDFQKVRVSRSKANYIEKKPTEQKRLRGWRFRCFGSSPKGQLVYYRVRRENNRL